MHFRVIIFYEFKGALLNVILFYKYWKELHYTSIIKENDDNG